MADYSKTIIYVIRCLNNPTLLYVGSTTDFIKRKHSHKSRCKSNQFKLNLFLTNYLLSVKVEKIYDVTFNPFENIS